MGVATQLTRLSQRVILLEGYPKALLAVLAGAASAGALAPYHLFPILFVTFPIFIWLLDGAVAPVGSTATGGLRNTLRRVWPAFKVGWQFGFGYFLFGFWWVGKAFLVDADEFIWLLPIAVIALPAGLALFWGLAASLARFGWGVGWTRLLALAAALTFCEWLRGTVLTGLPWNALGYAFMPFPVMMQTSGLIGLYGVTFITVLCASVAGICVFGRYGPAVHMVRSFVAAMILMVMHVGYGAYVLSTAPNEFQPDIRLRIVQPAIDQREKWKPENEAAIMADYLSLSNTNKGPENASVAAFSHVIWPESAFPFILTQRRDHLASIGKLLPPTTILLTGAMRLDDTGNQSKVYNALYAINGNGEIVAARDKTQLVPFGEFLPFQSFLEELGIEQLTRLPGGFTHGNQRTTVTIPATPAFLPLICYEIIFSGKVAAAGPRPQWIVNLTNDAWFGATAGPYQHAHQATVRAVEEGLPVVRAANNGISMVIDPYGRVVASLGLNQRGVVDARLPQAAPAPLFAKTGNLPVLIFICILFVILVVLRSANTNRLQ